MHCIYTSRKQYANLENNARGKNQIEIVHLYLYACEWVCETVSDEEQSVSLSLNI